MRRRLVVVMILAGWTAGCGGAGTAAPSAVPVASPSAPPLGPLPGALVGAWDVTITPEEQAQAEARLGRSLAGNAGLWELALGADGSYGLQHLDGEPFVETGQAGAESDVVTLRVTSFSAHATCHGNFPVGSSQRYRFAVSADTLTLTAPDSGCPDDVLILNTKPLQRRR